MPNKSNEKCISFLHCISSFKGTSYEHLSGKAIRSYFFLSLLAFISADIIFQKYLKSHSEKNIFITNFPFLTNSLTPPNPHFHPLPPTHTHRPHPHSLQQWPKSAKHVDVPLAWIEYMVFEIRLQLHHSLEGRIGLYMLTS